MFLTNISVFFLRWMHKVNKKKETRRNKERKVKTNLVLTKDEIKIPKSYETSEKNGIENLAFQSH